MNSIAELVQKAAVMALPIIFAITLHEAAHGYAARYFGDPTAADLGRISLNPLRHVDPVGTVLLPLALLAFHHLFGGSLFLFGFAKPVPVNFGRLRRPKQDMLWVAAAGPLANLSMALGWGLLLRILQGMPAGAYSTPLALMATGGIGINVVLMILNLFPLPPLDGGRIAVSLLPNKLARRFAMIEPLGFPILLLLLYLGALPAILEPFYDAAFAAIDLLFDLR